MTSTFLLRARTARPHGHITPRRAQAGDGPVGRATCLGLFRATKSVHDNITSRRFPFGQNILLKMIGCFIQNALPILITLLHTIFGDSGADSLGLSVSSSTRSGLFH